MNTTNKRLLTTTALLLCAIYAQAATITIDGTDNSVSIDGVCSISEAIINANDNAQTHSDCVGGDAGSDTINLTADITLMNESENDATYGRTGTPPISTEVILDGQGHVLERDGNLSCNNDNNSDPGEFRLLRVMSSGNLALNNAVIRGGCADGSGSMPIGGGLLNRGTLSLQNSVIDVNQARYGGGIASIGSSNVITSIDNTTFSNNSARNTGGGLSVAGGNIGSINNSSFSNNSATNGGGIYLFNSTLSAINNSTFSGNTAPSGSAIYNNSSTINILQNSLFHNGSTCYSVGSTFIGSNNLADGTSGTTCPGVLSGTTLTAATVGLLADNGCVTPLADGSCIMTHALLPGSEALDVAVGGTATDQRGFAANGTRDIGAFEAQPIELCPTALQTDGFNTTVATDAELIEAIECANLNGNGGDTINLTADITLTVEYENIAGRGRTGTPAISTAIVLDGQGHVLERDSSNLTCNLDGTSEVGEFRLLRVASGGDLTLNNAVIRGGCADGFISGSAPYGGGIYNQGTLSLFNTVIDANQARLQGGGVGSNLGDISSIINSTFSNNSANRGGGLSHVYGNMALISNSTFSNNNANIGGGLYSFHVTISAINNSTFSGNIAVSGSAIFNHSASINNLQNSLFHNGSTCFNDLGTLNGSNNLADSTSGANCPGVSVLTVATVGPLADNGCTTPLADSSCIMTHALLAGSEALDVAVGGTAADQRGFNTDGDRDIGAYEAQRPVITAPADIAIEATGPSTNIPVLGTATATDADSDDLALSISNDAAANYALGTHTVTWTVTDNHGHQGTDTQSLTVQDTTPPILSLVGTSPVNLNLGDTYTDAGATATDLVDDDAVLTGNISVNNPVDTNVLGSYTVTYDVTDNAGNPATQITRTVNVNGSPQVQLSTTSIDFGGILIGQNDAVVITVTNTGNANLNLNSLGTLTAPFAVTGGSCDPLPMTLTPGNNCTIEVSYSPTTAGNDTAQLVINSNAPDSPTLVELRGNGYAPAMPVPTLSQWALMLLLGCVLLSSGLFYRRRFD